MAAEASDAAEAELMVGRPAVVEGAAEAVAAEEAEVTAAEAAASCFLSFFLAFDAAEVKPSREVTPLNSRLEVEFEVTPTDSRLEAELEVTPTDSRFGAEGG